MANNSTFDPQTLSVVYECDETAPMTASSPCPQQLVTRVTTVPSVTSHGVFPVRQTASGVSLSQLPIHTRGYLAAQRQACNSNTMEHAQKQIEHIEQKYLPDGTQFTPQQREYLVRRAVEFSVNPVHSVGIESVHYSGTSNYADQSTAFGCPPLSRRVTMMQPVSQQHGAQPHAAAVHHVVACSTDQAYCNEVPPQVGHSTSQGDMIPGMQYEGDGEYISNCYLNAEPTAFTEGSPIYKQQMVPIYRAQLAQQNHFPVAAVVDSNNRITELIIKETIEVLDDGKANGNALIKNQRRSNRRLMDVAEDGVDQEGFQPPKRRPGRRKKPKCDSDGGEFQPGDTNTDEPVLPLTHGELLKQKKKNMAFPKGTFLIRYADLDSEEYDGHIWLVDNHQLLQKYTYDGMDSVNVKVFSRTERYSGWLCNCPWLYHPLYDVKGTLGNMEKVSVRNYPTRDELSTRRDIELKKAPEIEPEQIEVVGETGASDGEHSSEDHEQDTSTRDGFDEEMAIFEMEETVVP